MFFFSMSLYSAILIVNIGANDDDFGIEKKLLDEVDCNRLDSKIVEAKINAVLKKHEKQRLIFERYGNTQMQ